MSKFSQTKQKVLESTGIVKKTDDNKEYKLHQHHILLLEQFATNLTKNLRNYFSSLELFIRFEVNLV